MDPETKAAEERAWRRRTAHLRCRRCGGQTTEVRDGSTFRDDVHFAGLKYKVCSACGYERAVTRRSR